MTDRDKPAAATPRTLLEQVGIGTPVTDINCFEAEPLDRSFEGEAQTVIHSGLGRELERRAITAERELTALRAENERVVKEFVGVGDRLVLKERERAHAAEAALAEWRKVTAKETPAEAAKGIETLHNRWQAAESALAAAERQCDEHIADKHRILDEYESALAQERERVIELQLQLNASGKGQP